MLTAAWSTYSGQGRCVVTPVPPQIPREYRRHAGLSLIRPLTMADLRAHLAQFDARATAAEFAALCYPHECVIMGSAPAGVLSYRSERAKWFTFSGSSVTELDPATHRPRRVHPSSVPDFVVCSPPNFAPQAQRHRMCSSIYLAQKVVKGL